VNPRVVRVLTATAVSVFLAQWLEGWYRFAATDDPQAFYGAFLPYILIGVAFHTLIERIPGLSARLLLLIGALPGMALEWFVIGNSPWGNPEALQVGMLVFHGTYPLWGRVFDDRWFGPRQRRAGILLLVGSTVGLAPGLLIGHSDVRFVFFVLLPLLFYAALAAMTITGRPRG
jgi:hypothetical protein